VTRRSDQRGEPRPRGRPPQYQTPMRLRLTIRLDEALYEAIANTIHPSPDLAERARQALRKAFLPRKHKGQQSIMPTEHLQSASEPPANETPDAVGVHETDALVALRHYLQNLRQVVSEIERTCCGPGADRALCLSLYSAYTPLMQSAQRMIPHAWRSDAEMPQLHLLAQRVSVAISISNAQALLAGLNRPAPARLLTEG